MAIYNKYSGLSALLPVVQAEKDYVMNTQKIPPDQVPAYLMNKGLPQLGAAVADKIALDNAAKMQPNPQVPPAPPTVVEANRMAAQQARLQQVMNGRNNEMTQLRDTTGLAATNIPAPVSPQGMQAGGIVALAGGGSDWNTPSRDVTLATSYDFGERVPEQMDIVTYVKQFIPSFDSLSPQDKQQVLSAYDRQYRAARERSNPSRQTAPAAQAVTPDKLNLAASQGTPFGVIMPDTRAELDAAIRKSAATTTAPTADVTAAPAARRGVTTDRIPAAAAAPKEDQFSKYELQKPKDEAAYREERLARQQKEKTGAFSQADTDLAAFIKEQKDKGGDEKTAYKNFWVMTGASLLANKSPFFTQALGESVRDNYGNLVKDLKQLKDDTKQLRLQEIQLRRSTEQATESGSKEDRDRAESDRKEYQANGLAIAKARTDIEQKVLDRANERTIAQLRQYGNDRIADQLMRMWDTAQSETDPAKKKELMSRYQARLAEANTIISQTTAGGISAQQRDEAARRTALTNVRKSDAYLRDQSIVDSKTRTDEEKAQAKARMQRLEDEAMGDLGGPRRGGYVPESGNIRNPIDFSTLPQ
jgi:hypothetical protein